MSIQEKIVDLGTTQISRAVEEWRKTIGADNVLTGEAAASYNNCPSQIVRHIPAVLRPDNRDDIQKIVAIASRYNISLAPVSTGRNWGFGGSTPSVNSSVVVDLSRMNRIIDFMADLGVVTVEPGVTQGQLAEFLAAQGSQYMMTVSSSSPNCSVIGHALERGHAIMPYVDRFMSLTSLKAVLPDGSLYQSLLADGGAETIDRAYKWGVGPYLEGLFSQGGFGIVTQASFMLAPRPEQVTLFLFRPRAQVDLDKLLIALRQIKHETGHLISTFEIGTRTSAQDHTKIQPDSLMDGWAISGAIHATSSMSDYIIRQMKKKLKSYCEDFLFLTKDNLADYAHAPRWGFQDTPMRRYVNENSGMLSDMLKFYHGVPQGQTAMMYAYHHLPDRLQGETSLDAMEKYLRDTGLIWYWPLIPARGKDVQLFSSMMMRVSKEHGFVPVWNFNLEHSAYISAGVHIFYDPETEQDKAMAYYHALFAEGKKLGYLPHRAHVESSALYPQGEDSHYFRLLNRLKRAIDPKETITMRVPVPKHIQQKGE